jgi:hypothetical protein
VFWGCKKSNYNDFGVAKESFLKVPLSLSEAQNYYNQEVRKLSQKIAPFSNSKLKTRGDYDALKTDATFTALDVDIEWGKAKTIGFSNASVIEVPFKFKDGSSLNTSLTLSQENSPIRESTSRLLIRKDEQGKIRAKYLCVTGDSTYLSNPNNSIENFTIFKKNQGFSGTEMYYDLDGSLYKGFVHKEGRFAGKFVSNTLLKPNNNLKTRCAYAGYSTVCYEVERYSIRVGQYRKTTIVVQCDLTWISYYCSGNLDYEAAYEHWYYSSGYGDVEEIYELTYANLADDIIVSDVSYPCYQGVIENLRNNGNEEIKGYLSRFNTPAFKLTFHDSPYPFKSISVVATTDPKSTYDIDIHLNHESLKNASVEFTTSTVIHEILHAYLAGTGQNFQFQAWEHRHMAEVYGDCLEDILKNMYPNLNDDTIKALTYKGLQESYKWKHEFTEDQRTKYRDIWEQHHNLENKFNKQYGNPCH